MATVPRSRPGTILHDRCLLNGHHPPGSELARECPVLRRKRAISPPLCAGTGRDSETPKLAQNLDEESRSSETIKRDSAISRGRANQPGRPRLSLARKRQTGRERQRRHRAGAKADLGGAA
jgi:hypothetical protein